MNNLGKCTGVDRQPAGKGVKGLSPMKRHGGVDPMAAPFSGKKSPSMKAGGRKQRSKGGY